MDDCVNNFPRQLSAKFKGDFAYPTVKDRIPVILTKIVDTFYRMRKDIQDEHGDVAMEELKDITGRLSKLRNEIQTDKQIVSLVDDNSDVVAWNVFLKHDEKVQEDGRSSWFKSTWLFVECYFYRRVYEAIQLSNQLKFLDPFGLQKQTAFTSSLDAVRLLIEFLHTSTRDDKDVDNLRHHFCQFIQIGLWGNKCDLSISAGVENSQLDNLVEQLASLQTFILADDSSAVWQYLNSGQQTRQIDIVLDNAGFELITDLCLADFLLDHGIAQRIKFHGKRMPWFVSDVTEQDFHWTLDQLASHSNSQLAQFGDRWQQYLRDDKWQYTSHDFWTMPHEFTLMKTTSPELYEELTRAEFVIFKGDLNYRKLTGDLLWPHTTTFETALRGFHPTGLLALRTLKCDLAVGLAAGASEELAKQDKDWMINGTRGVIQFSPPKN